MISKSCGEVAALHREELRERLAAAGFVGRRRIISRTARMRAFVEEHVLGAAESDALRHRSSTRDAAHPVGVSALARTPMRAQRISPAHHGTRNRRTSSGCSIGDSRLCQNLACVAVERQIRSPLRKLSPAGAVTRSCDHVDLDSALAPQTHGRPMPRATTAAWLVMPPRVVRMPFAACMP
jgi:hypothetical protein